jgi:type I restriction enzyme, S subunit
MWDSVKLEDLFKIGSSKRVLKAEWKDSGVPFYRGREITTLSKSGAVDNDLFISEEHFSKLKANNGVPQSGDLLVTAIGTIGNTYIVREQDRFYFKDASVLWLHKTSDVDSRFVNYWFNSSLFYSQLEVGNGATVDTLSISKLKAMNFLLPPLPEQERIVAKLDAAFAEINRAINVSEIQIKNSFTIFENCVRQNFDVNIVNSEIKKLSEISTYFNGLTYSPKDVSEEGTIVLRSSNIQNGRMHFDDIVRVKKDIKEKLIVLPNDILICSRNGSKRLIGKCSLIGIQEEPMTFGTFMMVVRSEFNHYLQWFFQSNFFKEQISQGQNTAINQITRYMLDEVKLPIPDISIQNKISKQLSEIDNNVREVNKLQTQKISELLKLKAAILKQELQPSEAA